MSLMLIVLNCDCFIFKLLNVIIYNKVIIFAFFLIIFLLIREDDNFKLSLINNLRRWWSRIIVINFNLFKKFFHFFLSIFEINICNLKMLISIDKNILFQCCHHLFKSCSKATGDFSLIMNLTNVSDLSLYCYQRLLSWAFCWKRVWLSQAYYSDALLSWVFSLSY